MKKSLENLNDEILGFCSLEANWWVFGLRGLLSIAFGILTTYMPLSTILVFTIMFGTSNEPIL
jgi:uncharacterized membrane protein HdeD (DUF308 family)